MRPCAIWGANPIIVLVSSAAQQEEGEDGQLWH